MIPFGKRIDDSLMDMLARVIEARASKNIVASRNFFHGCLGNQFHSKGMVYRAAKILG